MINVDSSLQVYTLIVSWKYYGVIWSLLVGTGIVFIPIVFQLVSYLLDQRENGSMFTNGSDRSLSGIEVMLVRIFIIMLFIAMPVTPLTLDSNTVQVVNSPSNLRTGENIPPVGTCASTGTPFDDMESADGEAICGTNSNIPIWWYAVLRVSHAITQAAVSELTSDTNEGFRALSSFLRSGKIQDPSLQNLANKFEGECYRKAQARYSAETAGTVVGPGNDEPGFLGRDVSWQGSPFFIDEYYAELKTDSAIPGIAFDPDQNRDVDTTVETPEAGKVTCLAFWTLLEDRIFSEATSPLAGDNRASRWTQYTANIPGNNNREMLVQSYIQNSGVVPSQTAEQIFTAADRNRGFIEKGANRLAELPQAKEFIKLSFMASLLTDALIKALPILQAYILMFIVFMLPFGLVISGFTWRFVISSSALVFFVTFWSALWGFAAWVDDSMARALWPGGGDGIWAGVGSYLGGPQTWQEGNNKLIHSIVTAATYLGGPIWAGWIMSAAGTAGGHFSGSAAGSAAVGSVGSGGGAQSGAMVGSAVRSGSRAISKGLRK